MVGANTLEIDLLAYDQALIDYSDREIMVGANGFEPSTSWSRTRRASQAALRPD